MTITPVIISKNAEQTIAQTLNCLLPFHEVVVLDTGSTDLTMEIAKQYPNVKLYQSTFSGFGKCKNDATKLANSDWVLSIDTDEVLTDELIREIKTIKLDDDTVYNWRRCNFYKNKEIRYSGWGNDFVIRLYNKKTTWFKEKLVHEFVESEGLKIKTLNGKMNHYSYRSISDFSRKREFYSELFAVEKKGKRKSSAWIACIHSSYVFFSTLILKRGFLDGYIGLLIAFSNGYVSFIKYIKLYEANIELALAEKSSQPITVYKSVTTKTQESTKRIFALEIVHLANESTLRNSENKKNSVLFIRDKH